MKKINILLGFLACAILFSCKKDDTPNSGDGQFPAEGTFIPKANAKRVELEVSQMLTAIDETKLVFSGNHQFLSTLSVGDIVVGQPSLLAPKGYLRRITSISNSGSNFEVSTVYASLDELIEECNLVGEFPVNWDRTLTISDNFDWVLLDYDNNENTMNDQFKVSGNFSFTPKIIFELKKAKGKSILDGVFKIGWSHQIETEISANARVINGEFNKEKEFLEVSGNPFLVGWIVLVPEFELSAGVQGSIGASCTFGKSSTLNTEYYLEYKNRQWNNYSKKTENSVPLAINFEGDANLKAYLKAEVEVDIFELAEFGIYGEHYVKGEATANLAQAKVDYCVTKGYDFGISIASEDLFNKLFGDISFTPISVNIYSESLVPCGSLSLGNYIDCINSLSNLKGKWTGTFNQFNLGTYPMEWEVWNVSSCSYTGIHHWETLQNSTTTMEGYFQNDTLYWTEPTLLVGSNIILNGQYKATFSSPNTITGGWYGNSGDLEGTFTISK